MLIIKINLTVRTTKKIFITKEDNFCINKCLGVREEEKLFKIEA